MSHSEYYCGPVFVVKIARHGCDVAGADAWVCAVYVVSEQLLSIIICEHAEYAECGGCCIVDWEGHGSPPSVDEKIAEVRNEARYQLSLPLEPDLHFHRLRELCFVLWWVGLDESWWVVGFLQVLWEQWRCYCGVRALLRWALLGIIQAGWDVCDAAEFIVSVEYPRGRGTGMLSAYGYGQVMPGAKMRTRKEECCVEGLRCNYWVFAFKNQGMGLCWSASSSSSLGFVCVTDPWDRRCLCRWYSFPLRAGDRSGDDDVPVWTAWKRPRSGSSWMWIRLWNCMGYIEDLYLVRFFIWLFMLFGNWDWHWADIDYRHWYTNIL